MIDAKEMLDKVLELKDLSVTRIMSGLEEKPKEVDDFLNENWMQILDILDDALYEYLRK